MEQRFRTLIKKDDKFGDNVFVRGRICGFMTCMCQMNNNKIALAQKKTENGYELRTVCEPEQYEKFKNFTESHYPGLCVFDYHGEES